ncbi:Hint domain-containing protein [Enterococcus durans]|uniref:Hint domain-containing protein n=1 Tax=Enterococcus durans TaxID=53345 RepID=UPI003566C772
MTKTLFELLNLKQKDTISVISSTKDESELEFSLTCGGTKLIPMPSIRLDCFAKDTEISMNCGTKCKIQEINIGDKVLSDQGNIRTIENIYIGTEDKAIQIETKSGRKLLVTNNHPIETAQGIKCAQELRPDEILKMNNGLEEIKFVYEIPYNDTVYNLELDKHSMIIANDFIVGDFDMQIQNLSTKQSVKKNSFAVEVNKQLENMVNESYNEM